MPEVLLTSGATWVVPSDFGSLDSAEAIGPGGTGGAASANTNSGGGGGGGEYRRITSAANIAAGDTLVIAIPPGGSEQPTVLRDNTDTIILQANAGANGSGVTAGAGGAGGVGAAANFSGGAGRNGNVAAANQGGGGGGGAAGPLGAGGQGGAPGTSGGGGGGGNGGGAAGANGNSSIGGPGGNNNAGSGGGAIGAPGTNGGGGGGGTSNGTVGAGGDGSEFITHGSGGGGGGSGRTASAGGAGGFYGGGGGGGRSATAAASAGGPGGQGLIRVVYTVGSAPIEFGTKTRSGHGGWPTAETPLSSLSGTNASDWTIDARGHLVPSGTYGSFKTYAASSYSVTGGSGTVYAITMLADTAHIREMTSVANGGQATVNVDAINSHQLRTVMGLVAGSNGALVTGDRVVGRTGDLNPTALNMNFRAPAGGYAAGSGPRVIITSELIDTGLDGNGNPSLQNGFRIGAMIMDTALSGDIDFKLEWNYVQFWCDAPIGRDLLRFNSDSKGYGVHVKHTLFEFGENCLNPWACKGFIANNDGVVEDSVFRNLSRAINPSRRATIRRCVGQGLFEDFCTQGAGCEDNLIEDNFCFEWNFYGGAHPDTGQHSGPGPGDIDYGSFLRNVSIRANTSAPSAISTVTVTPGSGYTDGTYLKVGLIGGSGKYAAADITVSGGVIATTRIPPLSYNVVAGTGDGQGYQVGDVLTFDVADVGGTGSGGALTVATVIGIIDAQGFFGSGKTNPPGGYMLNATVENNIFNLTMANSVYMTRYNDPTVRYNTVLKDFQVDSGPLNFTPGIFVETGWGGTNGTWTHNIANVMGLTSQGGTVVSTPNLAPVAKSLPVYTALMPNYANTGITNRLAALEAFTPADLDVASGGSKNPDGTFNGALFPAAPGETIGAWNDGSVYDPGNPTWLASHPPAT